jgi:hypothetical protein
MKIWKGAATTHHTNPAYTAPFAVLSFIFSIYIIQTILKLEL